LQFLATRRVAEDRIGDRRRRLARRDHRILYSHSRLDRACRDVDDVNAGHGSGRPGSRRGFPARSATMQCVVRASEIALIRLAVVHLRDGDRRVGRGDSRRVPQLPSIACPSPL
jgi:hypothetical protein